MKKLILFDIDYTLFDTAAFRERLYKKVASVLGYDLDTFSGPAKEIYDEVTTKTGFFIPKMFSLQLARKFGRRKDRVLIEKSLFAAENFKDGLYKESLGIVERLAKIGTVGIFSRGYNSFQNKKIVAIKHLLDKKHIHIIIDKHKSLPNVINKYKAFKLYIIDDALDVLHSAWKLRKDVVTIWVKRGRYAMKQEPIKGFKPKASVDNLRQVVKLITHNS